MDVKGLPPEKSKERRVTPPLLLLLLLLELQGGVLHRHQPCDMGSWRSSRCPPREDRCPRASAGNHIGQWIAKGAGGKGPRPKNVKKCQKVFRHFSTIFAQGKNRQKSSKIVKKLFDTFRQFSRGTVFPASFGGALT